MPKKLQIVLQDSEYREIEQAARLRHLPIAQWVREALELARRSQSDSEVSRKLEVIRVAARFDFPTAEVVEMLSEIDSGKSAELRREDVLGS